MPIVATRNFCKPSIRISLPCVPRTLRPCSWPCLQGAGRIYIIDPLGNLMMSYAPEAASRALLEDMKRLLRLSHIG